MEVQSSSQKPDTSLKRSPLPGCIVSGCVCLLVILAVLWLILGLPGLPGDGTSWRPIRVSPGAGKQIIEIRVSQSFPETTDVDPHKIQIEYLWIKDRHTMEVGVTLPQHSDQGEFNGAFYQETPQDHPQRYAMGTWDSSFFSFRFADLPQAGQQWRLNLDFLLDDTDYTYYVYFRF